MASLDVQVEVPGMPGSSAREWLDISTLPPPGERPGRVFVVVEGEQVHSGCRWLRAQPGIARTQNDGFYPDDIARIEAEDHMDRGTGKVTHWMPLDLPPCPQFT